MSTTRNAAWFQRYGTPPGGRVRLFALPYSGGGANIYRPWVQAFTDDLIDFVGIQLPGREGRLREPPLTDMAQLCGQIAEAMRDQLDRPYLLFGHSMGALIAFELGRELRRRGLPLPARLVLSGYRCAGLPNPNPVLHGLSDAEFADALRGYGGTSAEVFDEPELLALLLPLLRADFQLGETHRHRHEPPLACPITALAGTDDHLVDPDAMRPWGRHCEAGFQLLRFPGGHFFPFPKLPEVIELLRRMAARAVEQGAFA